MTGGHERDKLFVILNDHMYTSISSSTDDILGISGEPGYTGHHDIQVVPSTYLNYRPTEPPSRSADRDVKYTLPSYARGMQSLVRLSVLPTIIRSIREPANGNRLVTPAEYRTVERNIGFVGLLLSTERQL